ncbi:FAD-dependent monooxygenase [Pseudonocardia sp. GCM10023141]|uniref:FAD-dependent monooxygenase n=1 Tax=Pseudonocardia sp. GCM10023141 TaxID=3252653 RepID=UPI00361B9942
MPLKSARRFAEIAAGTPPRDPAVIMRRAVVLGGGMAGLAAARVLSDHADEVLIIERDGTDVTAGPRPGVPQGSQVHALLPAGQVQLDRWFPGFTAAAVAAGAEPPDPAGIKLIINGVLRTAPMPASQSPALITTRPFLEAMVRSRTTALPGVTFLVGRAEGIRVDGDRVTGARYITTDGEPVTVDADLVVDAMGRSSRMSNWLEADGWPSPPLRRMPIKLNYATALFERDPRISDVSVSVVQQEATADGLPRIGGINAVEGNRWIMLIAGYGDDKPSRDAADYAQRCRRDFPSFFGDIAERARMIGDVVTFHQAESRRRDFHLLDRLPAGFIAAGDAVASFNPIYGQGMTSGILHASCLSMWLRSGDGDPAGPLQRPAMPYFEQVKVVVDAAWQVSTFADLALPHVEGPYPPAYPLIRWISGEVATASMTDATINAALTRVTTMQAPPSSLMRAGTVLRALRLGAVRRWSAARSG